MSLDLVYRKVTNYLHRTKFESKTFDDETLWEVFTKYGGSARDCYRLAARPEQVERLEISLKYVAEDLPSPMVIGDLYRGTGASSMNDELLEAFSQMITITPDSDRRPLIILTSPHIADLLYKTVLKHNVELFWQYFNQFSSEKQSHASAGWMWENRVISEELERAGNRVIQLERLKVDNRSDPPSTEDTRTRLDQIHLPFSLIFNHGDENSLADEFVRFTNDPVKATLFLPGRRNQATFNAFSISEDGLVTLFQPTVTQTHSIETSKLDFIWDAISKAQGLATGQAAQKIQGLYPTETKKWRLVFCVPRRVQTHWKHYQVINYQGKQPKRQWEKYIEQFVVAFNDTQGNSNPHYA